jgi:hypothetical protein
MFKRLVSFGVKSLFGGARRGQPLLAAFGTAVSIWGLFRHFSRDDKPVYTRELADGETLRITQRRGARPVVEEEV